jgi:hypothetical protein
MGRVLRLCTQRPKNSAALAGLIATNGGLLPNSPIAPHNKILLPNGLNPISEKTTVDSNFQQDFLFLATYLTDLRR